MLHEIRMLFFAPDEHYGINSRGKVTFIEATFIEVTFIEVNGVTELRQISPRSFGVDNTKIKTSVHTHAYI